MGPLFSIVGKMSIDFMNFIFLYFIILIMFALIGLLNFTTEFEEYRTLFGSIMTVLDICIGNYDFENFQIPSMGGYFEKFGTVYIIIIVIIFNILLLNLLVSILANSYECYDT